MLRKTSLEKRGFELGSKGDNIRWTQRHSSSKLIHLSPGFDYSRMSCLSSSFDDWTIDDKLTRSQYLLMQNRRYTMVLPLKWSRKWLHYIKWNRRLLQLHRESISWTTFWVHSLGRPLFVLLRYPSPVASADPEILYLLWSRHFSAIDLTFLNYLNSFIYNWYLLLKMKLKSVSKILI